MLSLRYKAYSANDNLFPQTAVQSANLFAECLNKVIDLTNYQQKIYNNEDFQIEDGSFLNSVIQNFSMFGSDKSTIHNYEHIYAYILNNLGRDSQLKILEIGIGTNNPKLISTMGSNGVPGASLRAFKNLCKNSKVFGADVDKNILFTEDRIETFFVDQLNFSSFDVLSKNVYNLIIDDGLHCIGANLNTLLFAIKSIADKGWIVIEDIHVLQEKNWHIVDFILKNDSTIKTYLVKTRHHYVYLINKL